MQSEPEPLPLVLPTVDRLDLKAAPLKSIFQSRTAFVALVIALAPAIYPPAAQWISENPEAFAVLVGLLNLALRYITKGRVVIWRRN